MTKPRLVIHVGPMKTGTTAIGAYFSEAKAVGKLPAEIVYPTHELWFARHRDERERGRITKHNQLSDFARANFETVPVRDLITTEQIEEKISQIAEHASSGSTKSTVVFIAENVSGGENGPKLIDVFSKFFSEITVVMAVRSPIAAAKSLLVHRIKDWRFDQVDLNLDTFLRDADLGERFNYEKLITRWATIPSISLSLVPYFEDESDGYAVVDRFMRIVSGHDAPHLDSDFGSRRIHPSLPLRSLKRLIALKKLGRRLSRVPLLEKIVRRQFDRTLISDRQKVVRGGFGARSAENGDWVLSPAERESVRAIYASSFSSLKKTLGAKANSGEWARWFAAEEQ